MLVKRNFPRINIVNMADDMNGAATNQRVASRPSAGMHADGILNGMEAEV